MLFRADAGDVEKCLLTRVVAARGEVISKVHSHDDAGFGRDAFAKVNTS